ncbi:hypothetical protein BD770DRAFT_416145 [Pilaira anomala]|nr:hypothetical protein BD770DRAFT_416145 [Pilaira anomala]
MPMLLHIPSAALCSWRKRLQLNSFLKRLLRIMVFNMNTSSRCLLCLSKRAYSQHFVMIFKPDLPQRYKLFLILSFPTTGLITSVYNDSDIDANFGKKSIFFIKTSRRLTLETYSDTRT